MEDAPPPYTSTPPQPPPYSQKAGGEGAPPTGFNVPQGSTEHMAAPTPVSLQPAATHVVVVQQQGSCPVCKVTVEQQQPWPNIGQLITFTTAGRRLELEIL